MSVPVELDQLRDEIGRFASVFLLTVTDDARPHAVSVTTTWDGDRLVLSAGRSSVANALARATVTLLWPAVEAGGFSLIVDGAATDAGPGTIAITPAKAVLHRSAVAADGSGAVGSECVPVLKTPA